MLADMVGQGTGQLDGEHDARLGNFNTPSGHGLLHIPARLADRHATPLGHRVSGGENGNPGIKEISGGVDPPGELGAIDTIATNHVTNLLPIMALFTHDPTRLFQPTVLQRHLELEVANCVGGVLSPVLANLFMHYAFDVWLARHHPGVAFERYCDDAVIHCVSREQAEHVRQALGERMAQVGLELHPEKTKIVVRHEVARSEWIRRWEGRRMSVT
jgi:hypothetical protein